MPRLPASPGVRPILGWTLFITLLLFSTSLASCAPKAIVVEVNGTQVALDVPPQTVNGHVLVPLRGIMEHLGARVGWDAGTKTITIQSETLTITLRVGATTATVNDRQMTLPVPAQEVRGRVMGPLRFIAEALNARVEWVADQRLVRITTDAAPAPAPQAGDQGDVTIARIIARPNDYVGREVTLNGTYQGWRPDSGPATKDGPPVTRSDWAFSDGTGSIYVTGEVAELNPRADAGAAIQVRGVVRLAPKGFPYLEVIEVTRRTNK